MRVVTGVHLPNYGDAATPDTLARMARTAEDAGLDSVWLSDHVVLVDGATSRYPFSADGSFFLGADEPWLEWVPVAAYLAAATERVDIGVGVCVLPLRHPLLLAKQVATLDVLSHGRVVLGAGVGWLAEEFAALGTDFADRGVAADAALRLMRAAWTGAPPAGNYGPFAVPPGVRCLPVPTRPVPVYVGGESMAAVRRLVAHGQGWYGAAVGGRLPVERLRKLRSAVEQACERAGRDPATVELALRLAASARAVGTREFHDLLASYVAEGVGRMSFDVGWRDPDRTRDVLAELARTVSTLAPS